MRPGQMKGRPLVYGKVMQWGIGAHLDRVNGSACSYISPERLDTPPGPLPQSRRDARRQTALSAGSGNSEGSARIRCGRPKVADASCMKRPPSSEPDFPVEFRAGPQ